MPEVGQDIQDEIAHLATKAWREKKNMDKAVENSHAFSLPALLQMQGAGIAENSTQWSRRLEEAKAMLDKIQRDIDERCFEDYGFSQNDRAAVASSAVNSIEEEDKSDVDEDVEAEAVEADPSSLAADLIGWLVGAAFGRFDVRLAIAERDVPPESEPFDPLPVCSAGMLTDSHGLPVKRSPDGYPISWPEDGVLLDDPGIGGMVSHRDIVRRVRQVIEIVWREKAADIERELCALLGARELREYLRKHTGFFERHLKRYSKSRRKAPIYWPLSTASGAYTVWVYYPRLTADTVYKIVAEHIGPKIGKVEDRIAQLEGGEAKREGREGARASKELGELAELLAELKEMREELLRVAKLSYKPDLNDGVQITAAPLWRLFRLPRWRSELERTWKALEDEECEWAHLACAIWPERVKEKCKTDKSLAIAHGLEAIYEEPVREDEAERPRRRGKRAGAAQARRGR